MTAQERSSEADSFVAGIARCLFVCSFSDAAESEDRNGYEILREPVTACGGSDWMDLAPSTTPQAETLAEELAAAFALAMGKSLDEALEIFASANDTDVADVDWSDVGHYWAMGWQGHGVSLSDRYEVPVEWSREVRGYGETPCLSELAPHLCRPCPNDGYAYEFQPYDAGDSDYAGHDYRDEADAWETAPDECWDPVMTSNETTWPDYSDDKRPDWLGEVEIDGSACNVWRLYDGRVIAQTVASHNGSLL